MNGTAELVHQEKPGFGGVCGVVVDRATGHVFIDLSDRGLFRSADQGRTWQRYGTAVVTGRTETPGCLLIDPTGKSQRLIFPKVYGGPIAVGSTASADTKLMHAKSAHVDWCAVDWTDPDMKFVLALKHESGGLLLVSRDGGKTFTETGKGYGPAWVFDADTAVVALDKTKDRPKGGIVRTADGGKTFEPAGTQTPVALPRWRDGTLYWLVSGALVKSTDKGTSWTKVCDVKDGRYGPVFGKHEKHLFVLTGAGVIASADLGQSWSKPVALPKALKGISALTWLDYDPRGDVLYLMRMGSDLYKLPRETPR
ncbi:MAG: hypothetical protein L0Y71_00855 [Gemmataceae bacterium]|nr:hypothetical protein [Gemmataceae bacterium]